MKILIPSAKNMNNMLKEYPFEKLNTNTQLIINHIKNLDIQTLSKIFKISIDKAKIEHQRFQDIANKKAKSYEAINLFDGLMYKNIDKSLFKNTQHDVFIVSSLYGIINVFDKISEHRLDFLQKIKNLNLKEIWKEEFDKFASCDDTIISLLSSEFEEVFSKELRDKFIKIVFLEKKDNKLRSHSTITKKCRGKFLNHLLSNKIQNIEDIKKISFDNFNFCINSSNERILYFIKHID